MPALVAPPSIFLGRTVQYERHGDGPHDKPLWYFRVCAALKKPQTTSIMWDADFLRFVTVGRWGTLMKELQENGNSLVEYIFDLTELKLEDSSHHLILQRFHDILRAARGGEKDAMCHGGNISKLIFWGMTSHWGRVLSALPSSLIELEMHFIPEPQTDEEGEDEERDRRARVESIIQQYVSPLTGLSSITIRFDDGGEEFLPLSGFSLAALLRCETVSKLAIEGCDVSSDPDDDMFHQVSPEQAVFEALKDNVGLCLLRFRAGRISSSLAETIARAIEVENRVLQYLDFGNMAGVDDAVAGAVTKAVLRNHVLSGLELNINSIQNFGFTSLGNLNCMDLSDNYLGDEGALQLAQLIPACRLERMNLADNCIGHIGGCAIAWSLQHNNTLSKINICDNPLLDLDAGDGPTSDVTRRIFNSFKDTPAYQQGFLGMLCASLRRNKTLSFINMASTGIDDSHGPLLAILARVSSLAGIGILRNSIGDQGCIYFCQALAKYPTSLRVILMEMNHISARGFYAMWKGVLASNDTLLSVQWGSQTYDIQGVERGQRDLDIAIRMNRAGLLRLRNDKNATQQQWIEALIGLRDDLDCSFPFLLENPLICRRF